ncbi:response regulator [Nitrosopumilus ureiphilus]|uniref:Response regulator n=1 Tax=Nitrosopumilus ureiphilus TaxID=1470067 RepID=A0A7D5RE80_9ARCH|nr:response regulator [Nitrosopumilus ureiphilus]QLH06883.1 response regulator [Nitrosopumilus ureiphilus]
MARKLLIAEDNKFTAIQYKKFFDVNGYKVTVFNDGAKCLEKYASELKYKRIVLKDKTPPYDYVLLDHDMPKMSGAEVSKKIYRQCPEQKIIFLSAYGQNILKSHESSKEGSLQIMQKPFSLEFLLKKIEPKSFTSIKRTNQENNVMTSTQNPETVR